MTRRIQILCIVALVSVAIWGCSREAGMPTAPDQLLADKAVPLTAVIEVVIIPDGLVAPFIIEGPGDIVLTGETSCTFTGNHPGRFNMYWGDVPGYITPDFQTFPVGPGKTITFLGDYTTGGGGDEAMGMYFDTGGMVTETTAALEDMVTAYVLYQNPSLPAVRGFEAGFDLIDDLGGGISTFVEVAFPVNGIDVGESSTITDKYNIIVGFSEPVLTSTNTVLATLTYNIFDYNQTIDTWMRASIPSSTGNGLPAVLDVSYNVVPVEMDQEDWALRIVCTLP